MKGYDALTESDLDEWVDKVFEPIIDNEASSPALTSPKGLKRNLKGNGRPVQVAADDWLSSMLPPNNTELSSLQSAHQLKQLIKGSGSDIATSDSNDNNNNNNSKAAAGE